MSAGPYVKNSLDLMENGPSVHIPSRIISYLFSQKDYATFKIDIFGNMG